MIFVKCYTWPIRVRRPSDGDVFADEFNKFNDKAANDNVFAKTVK